MNCTVDEINDYLKEHGWKGRLLYWLDFYEIREWNKHPSMAGAYGWFTAHRQEMFERVKKEYQAKATIGVCHCGKCSKCKYG